MRQNFISFRRVFQYALTDVDEKTWITCESHVQSSMLADKAMLRAAGPYQHCLQGLAGPL